MARFLADSTVLIHLFRRQPWAREWLADAIAAGHDVGVCAINVAEVYTGAHEHERPEWAALFQGLLYWPVTLEAAEAAGRRRYDLARVGTQVHLADALVAAVAERAGATVATGNIRDFEAYGVAVLALSSEPRV